MSPRLAKERLESEDSLLTAGIANKCGQSVDIPNHELSIPLFEDSDFGKAIEFACDGLAMGARAARKFSVSRRWNNFGNVPLMS